MILPNKNQQQIKHGVQPTKLDKKDYSYLRTFGTTTPQVFEDFQLDANLYPAPNQNIPNDFFGIPALPYGCTEYSTAEMSSDEDKVPYNPMFIEGKMHANANGGADLRSILNSACVDGMLAKGETTDAQAKTHVRAAYFRVGQNPDYFGGFLTAMYNNKRPIVVGTPWFQQWFQTDPNGIVAHVLNFLGSLVGLSWHAWKISGQETINGVPYLTGKVWLGQFYGTNGFGKWSREEINGMMTVPGTAAFTLAKADPAQIKTVGETYIFKNNLAYGQNNPEVAELQKALQSLGYTIVDAVTVNYLGETRDALARFQKDQGISDDGTHFGPLTRYAMNRVLNPSQTLFGAVQLFLQTFLGIM